VDKCKRVEIKIEFLVVLANNRIDVTTTAPYSKQRIYSIPKSVVFCPPNVERAGKWLNVCHVSLCCRNISRYWKFFRCFSLPHFPPFLCPFFIFAFTSLFHLHSLCFFLHHQTDFKKEEDFISTLYISGKILLSEHLSIIRAAFLSFELSSYCTSIFSVRKHFFVYTL
jgi:hypothetical protein